MCNIYILVIISNETNTSIVSGIDISNSKIIDDVNNINSNLFDDNL